MRRAVAVLALALLAACGGGGSRTETIGVEVTAPPPAAGELVPVGEVTSKTSLEQDFTTVDAQLGVIDQQLQLADTDLGRTSEGDVE